MENFEVGDKFTVRDDSFRTIYTIHEMDKTKNLVNISWKVNTISYRGIGTIDYRLTDVIKYFKHGNWKLIINIKKQRKNKLNRIYNLYGEERR